MAKKQKTKEEKIKTSYRLQNFRIKEGEVQERKDVETFSYLDSKFVVKDLTKTAIVSMIIVGIIFVAKKYLS